MLSSSEERPGDHIKDRPDDYSGDQFESHANKQSSNLMEVQFLNEMDAEMSRDLVNMIGPAISDNHPLQPQQYTNIIEPYVGRHIATAGQSKPRVEIRDIVKNIDTEPDSQLIVGNGPQEVGTEDSETYTTNDRSGGTLALEDIFKGWRTG